MLTRNDDVRPQPHDEDGERREEAPSRQEEPDGGDREEGRDDGGSAKGKDDKKPSLWARLRGFVRRRPILTALIVIVLIAAAVAGILYWLHARHFETTDDAFIEARNYSTSPRVSGYVAAIYVTDNQHVEAGTVLARIDPRDYQVQLEQSQAQVQSAEASIANVDAQIEAQKAAIVQADAQVTQAQANLSFAQSDANRYSALASRGNASVQQAQQSSTTFQQRKAEVVSAQAQKTSAERRLDVLRAQRLSAQADLARAQAQRDQSRLQLSYTDVVAPQAGRVAQLTSEVGQFVQAGQALLTFVPDTLWVVANYKETQITDMRPGQPVELEVDAYPDRALRGHIESVQPGSGTAFSLLPAQNATGNYVKIVQRVPVKIVIDEVPRDITLGPGMSVVPRARVR